MRGLSFRRRHIGGQNHGQHRGSIAEPSETWFVGHNRPLAARRDREYAPIASHSAARRSSAASRGAALRLRASATQSKAHRCLPPFRYVIAGVGSDSTRSTSRKASSPDHTVQMGAACKIALGSSGSLTPEEQSFFNARHNPTDPTHNFRPPRRPATRSARPASQPRAMDHPPGRNGAVLARTFRRTKFRFGTSPRDHRVRRFGTATAVRPLPEREW